MAALGHLPGGGELAGCGIIEVRRSINGLRRIVAGASASNQYFAILEDCGGVLTPGFAHRTGERKCGRLGIIDFGAGERIPAAIHAASYEDLAIRKESGGCAGAFGDQVTGGRKLAGRGIVDFGRSSGSIPARPSTHDEHCAVLQELRGVAGASKGHAARGLKAAGSGIVKFGGRKGMALGAAAAEPTRDEDLAARQRSRRGMRTWGVHASWFSQ